MLLGVHLCKSFQGNKKMKLLAMDLSLSCPAFAVLTVDKGVPKVVHLSHVKTNTKKTHGYRLFEIYNHMKAIYEEHPDIDEVVREKGFSRFPSVTQTLFKVVGISDACAYKHGFDTVHEIPPTTVKKLISGSGKGTKDDVASCVSIYLGTNINFKTDDESDAVAVGLSHLIKKKALV
jgi:crossover junction endodeoxyribonuclease RuvC